MEKNIFYILTILILFSNILYAQDPYSTHTIYSNANEGCYGSQFLNVDLGYAVVQGSNGARLAKTTNGGRNWQYYSILAVVGLPDQQPQVYDNIP